MQALPHAARTFTRVQLQRGTCHRICCAQVRAAGWSHTRDHARRRPGYRSRPKKHRISPSCHLISRRGTLHTLRSCDIAWCKGRFSACGDATKSAAALRKARLCCCWGAGVSAINTTLHSPATCHCETIGHHLERAVRGYPKLSRRYKSSGW